MEEQKNPAKTMIPRTLYDSQRIKLEKLMKNPDKPVIIPEKPKERGAPVVPDFVRNVMGSSAGAGSGEFHVYRHLRRKEYARQRFMTEKARWEKLEDEYHEKLEENKRKCEEVTAKKRAKRLKRKQKMKNNKKGGNKKTKIESEEESEDESDEEDENDESEKAEGVNIEVTSNKDEKEVSEETNVDENQETLNGKPERCEIDEINDGVEEIEANN